MKAVWDFTAIPSLEEQDSHEHFRIPACFLPIMGKVFVQHVVEYVERLGIRELDLYLSRYADDLERFIGDGERWGVSITYHLVKQGMTVKDRLSVIKAASGDAERLLWCDAVHLPMVDLQAFISLEGSVRFTQSGEEAERATGWAVCTPSEYLSGIQELPELAVPCLDLATPGGYLRSSRYVMDTHGAGLIIIGKEIRDGIWVGPGARIPVGTTVIPPVYIESHVQVHERAIIGPYTELGSGSIVDANSYAVESLVLAGSYIGKGLDVRRCLVHENLILNADLRSVYAANDEILLTSVDTSEPVDEGSIVSILSRFVALLFALLTLPLFPFLYLAGGTRGVAAEYVRIPKMRSKKGGEVPTRRIEAPCLRRVIKGSLWRHFLLHLLPGLWAIVTGKVCLVGLPLRTVEEFSHLSTDWQGVYLRSRPGLLCEADIIYRKEQAEEEMLFASEMMMSVNDTKGYQVKLFFRYLGALFTGRGAI